MSSSLETFLAQDPKAAAKIEHAIQDYKHARNDLAHALEDLKHAKNDCAHAMQDFDHLINDFEHALSDWEAGGTQAGHATVDLEHAGTDKVHAEKDLDHALKDITHALSDFQHAMRDLKHLDENLESVLSLATEAGSAGGGIYDDSAATKLTIGDTILAGNTVGSTESDLTNYGTVTDHGYNLYGQNGNAGGFTGNGTTDIELATAIDTVLAPLGNYGGPTETMALVAGSPAYLAGGARGSVTTDQRGDSRGSVISIGAWDYNPTQFTAANSTIVNTTSDAVGDVIGGTTLSLRDAFFYSNVGAVTNPTITFNTNPADGTDFSTSQTIDLAQGELVIDKSVTVDGSTTGSVIVSGQGLTRDMEIDGTSSGIMVTLNNLTLTDGNASGSTGGLGAARYDDGGGLLVYAQSGLHATVTINDCTVSNNTADGQNGGGGIYLAASSGGFTTATITNNAIGGSTSGLLTLHQSVVGGNGAMGGQGEDTGGPSGVGGDATSILTDVTNQGGNPLTVIAQATGGNGGQNVPGQFAGVPGGNGGQATAQASGSSNDGKDVSVQAVATGGDGGSSGEPPRGGGEGVPGAGGNGASELMQNDVSGATAGLLTLKQDAVAGRGGQIEGVGGTAGVDGTAESDLTGTNPDGGSLDVETSATSGRSALANSIASSTATSANPSMTVTGNISSKATASDGANVTVSATTSVPTLASSSSSTSYNVASSAAVGNGAGLASPSTGFQAGAYIAADTGNYNAGTAGLPAISFSLSTASNISGATTTYSSGVEMTLNLASAQDIKLALDSPVVTGNGFQSLLFTITENGDVVVSEDFTGAAQAESYFDSNSSLDLGNAQVGELDLAVDLTMTDDPPGDGFSLSGGLGTVATPEPSTWMLLAFGLVGLLWKLRSCGPVQVKAREC